MIRTTLEEGGALLRVTLASPRANILDIATMDAISEALLGLRGDGAPRELRAVLLDHDGPDFSFGASVEEHLPERVDAMLHAFGRAVRAVVHAPVPVLAAVDGRCLGGGAELALAAHLVFASKGATFAQPEIALAVFPPAAVALVPWRGPLLRRMAITGEPLDAEALAAAGLVVRVSEEPAAEAALAFFREHLAPRSAFALRQVVAACDPGPAFDQALYQAEQRYLQQLMRGRDPVEGLRAFTERRKPRWEHA